MESCFNQFNHGLKGVASLIKTAIDYNIKGINDQNTFKKISNGKTIVIQSMTSKINLMAQEAEDLQRFTQQLKDATSVEDFIKKWDVLQCY